jgi:hypothetical protein
VQLKLTIRFAWVTSKELDSPVKTTHGIVANPVADKL